MESLPIERAIRDDPQPGTIFKDPGSEQEEGKGDDGCGSEPWEEATICDTCREIDFTALLAQPCSEWNHSGDDEDSLFPLVHADDCDLCAILTPKCSAGQSAELSSYMGMPPYPAGVSRSVALAVRVPEWGRYDIQRNNLVFCVSSESAGDEESDWRPKAPRDTPDYTTARAWISQCRDGHGSICTQSSSHQLEGMRLIDVSKRTVVDASGLVEPRWITLSCPYSLGSEIAEIMC